MSKNFNKVLNSTLRNKTPIALMEFSNFILRESSIYDIIDNLAVLETLDNNTIKTIVSSVTESIEEEFDKDSGYSPEEKIEIFRDDLCQYKDTMHKILLCIKTGENAEIIKAKINKLLNEINDFRLICKIMKKLICCVIDSGADKSIISTITTFMTANITKFSGCIVNELNKMVNCFPEEARSLYLTELIALIDDYKAKYDMMDVNGTIVPRALSRGKKVVLKKPFPEVKIRQPYFLDYDESRIENFAAMNPVVATVEEDDIIECDTEDDLNEINSISDYYLEEIISKARTESFNKFDALLFNTIYENFWFDIEEASVGKKIARKIAGASDKALQKVKKSKMDSDKPLKIIGRSLKSWENHANETIEKIKEKDKEDRIKRSVKGGVDNSFARLMKIVRDAIVVGAVGSTAGIAIGALTLAGIIASNKYLDKRAKTSHIKDLEMELKMTKEKIEDAKSNNDTKEKYRLMRIENKIERTINVVKHGVRDDVVKSKVEVKKDGK